MQPINYQSSNKYISVSKPKTTTRAMPGRINNTLNDKPSKIAANSIISNQYNIINSPYKSGGMIIPTNKISNDNNIFPNNENNYEELKMNSRPKNLFDLPIINSGREDKIIKDLKEEVLYLKKVFLYFYFVRLLTIKINF